jgi:hypothetical protein
MQGRIRFLGSHDLDGLCSDLLAEAKTMTGTWLLATHNRVLDALPELRPDEFECFFIRIINAMTAPDAPGRERFKSAQIYTLYCSQQCPRVDDILVRFKTEIMAATASHGDPLDQPIAKLFLAFYEQAKWMKSSPTLVVRCRVMRPNPIKETQHIQNT